MTIIIKIKYALLMTGLLIFGTANASQTYDIQFSDGIKGKGKIEFLTPSGWCDITGCNGRDDFSLAPTVDMIIDSLVSGEKFSFNISSFLNVGFDDIDSSITWSIDESSKKLTKLEFAYGAGNQIDNTDPDKFWAAELNGNLKEGITFDEALCPEDCPGFVEPRHHSKGKVSATATNDTDPAGSKSDVIISFGSSEGIWRWMNNESWQKLHPLTPEKLAIGDFDGNGIDDIIISFGSGKGIWRWMNNNSWQKLHPAGSTQMVVADLDKNGKDDIVISFGPGGIWRWMNNSHWQQLHPAAAVQLAVGDLDNNGEDDVIVSFGQDGIWRWMNNSNWLRLHPLSSQYMVTGDFDGNDIDDIVISFGPAGLWRWMNNNSWQLLHPANSENMVVADLDNNGKDDVIVSFDSDGLWRWMNNTTWQRLHLAGATRMAVGDLDNNGQDDVIISFTFGTWRWMNNANWQQLHSMKIDRVVVGNLDNQIEAPESGNPEEGSGTNTIETGNGNNSQNDPVIVTDGNERTDQGTTEVQTLNLFLVNDSIKRVLNGIVATKVKPLPDFHTLTFHIAATRDGVLHITAEPKSIESHRDNAQHLLANIYLATKTALFKTTAGHEFTKEERAAILDAWNDVLEELYAIRRILTGGA
jgi:hypothetical protein